MRKLLLSVLLLPLIFGFSSHSKNSKNVEIATKNTEIVRVLRGEQLDSFIAYWNDDFRANNPKVCDITYDAYLPMYERYQVLSKEDRATLNETPDTLEPEYTIGAIVKTLVGRFYPNNNKTKQEKKKLDQSAIIIIAVVVALVGATSISILFILRNQKVIE